MSVKTDARQIRSRDNLTQLAASVANKELDDLLRSADSELTMPLRMRQTYPAANLIVNIGNIAVTNPEHARKRTIPPISNVLPAFTSGTVTLGATGANNATPSTGVALALGMTSSQFLKVGIHLDGNGNLVLTKGVAGASEAAATSAPFAGNTHGIGYIVVRTDGSNNVQTLTDAYIYQYIGGGAGSGSGDASSVRSRIEDQLSQSFYEYAAYNIASIDEDDKFTTGSSTATYDLVDNVFDFAGAAADLLSIELLDPQFQASSKDIDDVEISLHYKVGQVDTAPTVFVSRAASDAEAAYYPVTMERLGQSEVWIGRKQWSDDFKYVGTTLAQGGDVAGFALTNAAGTAESLANIFNASITAPQTYYPASVSFTLSRTITWSVGQGSFRIALYESNVNTGPSNLLYAGAWIDISTVSSGTPSVHSLDIPTKYTNRPLNANKYFYAVIETDATYKSIYVATTKELRARRSNVAGASFSLDGTTWTADATGTYTASWTYHTDYQDLLFDGVAPVTTQDLNATTNQWLSQPVAIPATEPYIVKAARISMDRDGSPTGYVSMQIIRASGSNPSTDVNDIIAESTPVAVTSVPTTSGDVYFYFGEGAVLPAGATYHFVLKPSTDYVYSVGNNVGWNHNATATLAGRTWNGTTWSAFASELSIDLFGRELKSRLRVVSSMASGLNGYAMLYDREATAISSSLPTPRQVFHFTRGDNDYEFDITAFAPHPDLLKCYYIEGGQVFKVPAFTLRGTLAQFPSGTFGGVPTTETITLVFEQLDGSSTDSSDLNALLMAENHLGSTDGAVDRSAPGRGILLRRPDGTLREIAINDNDELEVYSV